MSARDKTPRERSEEREAASLRPEAALSTEPRAIRREHPYGKDDFRTEFDRDYTRIIHSRAFRRLRHKTQVFISPQNDHICTRLEHSLHVASVAKTLANALDLNAELVTAMAAGHDLGHAPFGHRGEKCLDELAKRRGLAGFAHELHSLRVVDELESPYPGHRGLNLTFAVRDGIACHCGERFESRLEPDRGKNPDSLHSMQRGRERPATLEGCVVRWADKVAYLGRDLEDALRFRLIEEQDIPSPVRTALGVDNRSIIAAMIRDIVNQSSGQDFIAVSDGVHEAVELFNEFNRIHIYETERVTRSFRQVDKAMQAMFEEFAALIEGAQSRDGVALFPGREEPCTHVLAEFLRNDVEDWRRQAPARIGLDFIAGMTDSFFVSAFEQLFLPRGTF